MSDDPRRLVLARRRVDAPRAPTVLGVGLEHRDERRPQGGLRLGHVERRADRHPVHDRARVPASRTGVVRLCGRERPGAVSGPARCPDRRRLELHGRQARARRRPGCMPALGALQRVSAERRSVVDGWLRRDVGPQLERHAAARMDLRRRRRIADPARSRALRRGRVGRDRPRHPLHGSADGERSVWPASHKASTGGTSDPPMGAWFRLKASFDISGFSAQNQVDPAWRSRSTEWCSRTTARRGS